ncbi:MAG: flagellar protein FlaG [Deltaproteobacteria bacterium]|nr:flagellar protein FlaG [Deltaproteobacteria bacterium]
MNAVMASADISIRGSPSRQAVSAGQQGPRPTQDAPPRALPPQESTDEAVVQAADGVNAFLKASGTTVQFAFQADAKRMMVEVLDNSTGEVLRTIPSKELLELSARIGEMVGVLIDKTG